MFAPRDRFNNFEHAKSSFAELDGYRLNKWHAIINDQY